MKKLNLLGLVLAGVSASALVGCSEDISLSDQMNEDYVKSFIERYGLPGEGNMFNMAKHGQVTVKSSEPVNVEVIAMENGKYYSFAYCQVQGTETIHFDIPSYIQDIALYVNDQFHYTKVGATYDLDHPTRSRDGETLVWTDDMLNNDAIEKVTLNAESMSQADGRVKADFGLIAEEEGGNVGYGTTFNHIGYDLKKYVNEDASAYERYDNHGNGPFHGGGEHRITILNVNKPDPSHEYEIGAYYGNGPDMLHSDKVIFIPFYRTAEVKDGNSVVAGTYNGRKEKWPFENAGAEFTIDFAEGGEMEWTNTNYFRPSTPTTYFGRGFTLDNKATYGDNSLETRLERHAAAQSKLPTFRDLRENGATDYTPNLPRLDDVADPWDFYDKYDAYIWNWLNDHGDMKKDINEYDQFRRLLATDRWELPEHAVPYVRHEGGQKYRVSYFTSYAPNGKGTPDHYIGSTGESLYKINDNLIYTFGGVTLTIPGSGTDSPHDYVIYMKDLNTGEVVSTTNGSRVKSTSAYIMTENYEAHNGFPITMIDFDGDGVYNDFVYQTSWPGGTNPGPQFEEYTWYLACEDLGSTDDCDFNDAVFAIQYIYANSLTIQNINVRPLAAGGIYPLYLMWSDGNTDYMVGKEIHSWLGKGDAGADGNLPFINTEDETFSGTSVSKATFEYDILQHDMNLFSFDPFVNALWGSGTMAGFWVLVDKENKIADLANQEINFKICDADALMAKYPSLWKVNNHPVGGNSIIPQMMLVTQEWEWPRERFNIADAYPQWQTWMGSSDAQNVKWYGYQFEGVDRSKVVKRWE